MDKQANLAGAKSAWFVVPASHVGGITEKQARI